MEMAERATAGTGARKPLTWPELCDDFQKEVDRRKRGADGSKDELKKRARFLRSSAILGAQLVEQHDAKLALVWLRDLLSTPKKGTSGQPRDPLTARNLSRVLSEIYRYALTAGAFPADRRLPTESDEFRQEINGALREKQKLGQVARVACPVATVMALASSENVSDAPPDHDAHVLLHRRASRRASWLADPRLARGVRRHPARRA